MMNLDTIKRLRGEKIWFFRFKKFDTDSYLITNDTGRYMFLTWDEFEKFISWEIVSWDEKFDELIQKWFLKDKNYEDRMVIDFNKKNSFLAYGPTLHIMVVTLRCNHKCRYCHAAAAPVTAKELDMSLETARKVVDTIFCSNAPALTIEFQWGEPLLNWDVIKFTIEYATFKAEQSKKTILFALVSNFSLMDEDKLEYLLHHSVWLSTSLDGNEETHNYNRTFISGNSFDKVTYWIKRINEEYIKRNMPTKIGALLTVTRKTFDNYREAIDTYRSLGLTGIFFRPLNPYGFAVNELKTLGYTNDEFMEFYKKSLDYIFELNTQWVDFYESHANIYLQKILTEFDPNYLDARSPCGACIWQVAYNYNWNIYSCDEWRMLARMGDENFQITKMLASWKETYMAMIQSETASSMVQFSTLDGLPWYNQSVFKPYLWVCPINSYKLTGSCIPNYAKDQKRDLDEKILTHIFSCLRDANKKNIFENWTHWKIIKTVVSQCEVF